MISSRILLVAQKILASLTAAVFLALPFAGLAPSTAFAADDGPPPSSITVESVTLNGTTMDHSNSITVAGDATISAAVEVKLEGSDSWHETGWYIGTHAPSHDSDYTCVDTADHDSAGTYTENFNVTAPSSDGTYDVYFKAYPTSNCSGSGDTDTFSRQNGVIVKNLVDTTTTVTSDTPDPSMVGQSYEVDVQVARASGSDYPTGTVSVSDGNGGTCTVSSLTAPHPHGYSTGSCDLTSTSAGDDTLTATYSGDSNFNGSSGTTAHEVDAPAPTTGTIEITKYECPADTTVTRADNGVGGSVPEGCTPDSGATFGYVHGDQTDANSPYPELSESLTAGGATDGSGLLDITDLPATGRYLIEETDASNQRLEDSAILGLYCAGDGDTSGTNDNQELTFVPAGGTTSCVAYDPAPPSDITVVASKVVCQDPGDLPEWGAGGDGPITATTAADWVASHSSCSIVPGWTFEWGDQNAPDGGDATIGAVDDYTEFGPTDATGAATTTISLDGITEVHLREELQDGYIPFTYSEDPTNSTYPSAQFYCADDVLNNDNWDFIRNPQAGSTYYCVGFNAPVAPSCNDDANETIVSADDGSTTFTGDDGNGTAVAVNMSPITSTYWTASIPGATWIWSKAAVTDGTVDNTETFTRTFDITGTPLDSSLEIAADNFYSVSINGHDIDGGAGHASDTNFTTAATYSVPAADLVSGTNTLTIVGENEALDYDDPIDNPAGILYSLTVNDNECVAPPPSTSTVTMCKYDPSEDPLSGWTLTLAAASPTEDENLVVPAGSIADITSSNALTAGVSYLATAMGTWFNRDDSNQPADAEYDSIDGWTSHMDGYDISPYFLGPDEFDLQVNDAFVDWGTYNSAHTYAYSFIPSADGTASFGVFDGTSGVKDASWYGDNSGSLDVNLTEGYAGATGENGCVEFDNVPYGHYVAGEVAQDGWTNVSGLGDVTVDSPTEEFDVVNQNSGSGSGEGGGNPTFASNTIVVKAADLAVDANFADAFSNPTDWFFENDQSDTLDDTLGSFVDGPDTAPLGSGSAQISIAGSGDGVILGTFELAGTPLSEVKTLSYDTYRVSGNPADALALQFDINTDGTGAAPYEGRLVFEPYLTGAAVDTGSWQSWNATTTAGWWFSDPNQANLSGCHEDSPCTLAQVLATYPNIGINGITGFKAGSGWNAFTGDVDDFAIELNDGINDTLTTTDFEPTDSVDVSSGNGGGGGGSVGLVGDINGDGQVNFLDFALLMAAYGDRGVGLKADLNGDGVVDGADLAILLAHWTF